MAVTQDMLEEARQALHDLLTGCKALVVVDQNGERVEYQAAKSGRLAAYVQHLERQVAGGKRPSTVKFCTSKGL
jgi:hypothetical protein